MCSDENVFNVRELKFDCQKIRNVALYDKTSEECYEFPDLLIEEKECGCGFSERERCTKRMFNLQSKIQGYHGGQYLFNLIDAPHIMHHEKFVHSLHLVDGMVVSVYSSGMLEKVLPTVLNQNVKPILFINDVDDLSYGLNYDASAIRQEIDEMVCSFNELVKIHAPADKKEEWQTDITSVIFGSIQRCFAFDFEAMKESGIEFEGMVEAFRSDEKDFPSEFPFHRVLARAIIEHLPSPDVSEPYRILKLWNAAGGSHAAQSMMHSYFEDSLTSMIIYNKNRKKYYCRVFSGTLHSGHEAYLEDCGHNVSIELDESIGEVSRGNLVKVNLSGYDFEGCGYDAFFLCADRISRHMTWYLNPVSPVFAGFRPMEYSRQHVCSMSLHTENSDDFIRLVENLHRDKQNPIFELKLENDRFSIKSSAAYINELIHGAEKYFSEGAEVSGPFAIYRQSVLDKSGPVEAKSQNKQNAFSIEVEPLDGDSDEADCVWRVKNNNVFLNMTDGIPFLDEAKPALIEAFEDTLKEGPMASCELTGLKVKLVDAGLHEVLTIRSPEQIMPALKKAINDAVMLANPYLLEPVEKVLVFAPMDCLDGCIQKISDAGLDIARQESLGDLCEIEFDGPVSKILELLGEFDSIGKGNIRVFDGEVVGFKAVSGDSGLINEIRPHLRMKK